MAKPKVINPHSFEKLILAVDELSLNILNKIFLDEVNNGKIAIKGIKYEDIITVFYSAYSQGGDIYVVFLDNFKFNEKTHKIEKMIIKEFHELDKNSSRMKMKFGKVNLTFIFLFENEEGKSITKLLAEEISNKDQIDIFHRFYDEFKSKTDKPLKSKDDCAYEVINVLYDFKNQSFLNINDVILGKLTQKVNESL